MDPAQSPQSPQASGLPDSMAMQLIARAPFSLVLSDPRGEDLPIIYVNAAFEQATGYSRQAAIGRNCRFLQGKDTDPAAVRKIARAIAAAEEVTVDILNYRADGAPFWNRLMIAPLLDSGGRVQYFVGVQKVLGEDPAADPDERVDAVLRKVQHRVKNHLSMVLSMIRTQARATEEGKAFDTLARRVESIQFLYEELNARGAENREAVALGPYLNRVATGIAQRDGRPGIRVRVEVDAFTVPMQTAVNLGLILSEALTNALQHAFPERDEGLVEAHIREREDGGIMLRVVDDGIGLPEEAADLQSGLGGRIIRQLARALDAELRVSSADDRTTLALNVPPTQREAL